MHTSLDITPVISQLEHFIDGMMTAPVLNSNERFSNELQLFLHEAHEKGIEQIQAVEIILERMKIHGMNLPNVVSVATFEAKQKLVLHLQQVMSQ